MDGTLDQAVAAVLAAKKYRDLPEGTVRRVAASLLPAHPRAKELAKAVKARLHQVSALYFTPEAARRAHELIEGIDRLTMPERNERARRILALHVSTAERLPHLADFYGKVAAAAGPCRTLLDVACGANAFAWPFPAFPAAAGYLGTDIDRRLVDAANGYLAATGLPARCEARDAFDPPPAGPFDLALVLKTLPCLERQERGAAARLLAALPARAALVSFPARSVGGREVGMASQYAAFAAALAAACGATLRPLDTPYEPAWLFTRAAPAA